MPSNGMRLPDSCDRFIASVKLDESNEVVGFSQQEHDAAFLSGCRDSVSLPGDLKRHQAKFFCITRCVALKRTRATSPCAGPRHDLSPRARSARTDLAEISRRVRAVIF